nr:glucose-methanol-choline oxidoreductase, FAD/NAD(P)-binding domain protein [Tanacetum cinerariifolium]
MNANDEYENLSDHDDEMDLWFMTKAIEMHELMQQEAGAYNDLTVLHNSSLFDDLLNYIALVASFLVNGVQYEKRYYLADGIYPQWATESCSAKELFQSCKQHGHVVDTFIPNKRSKTGMRFGFVRFINVLNEERLVNNLCTVWIDRFKLHANIARFHRTLLNEKKSIPKKAGGVKKDTGVNEVGNSYVHVVKGQMQPGNKESEAILALFLSDECLLSKDLSKSLFGRVEQFSSLANFRKAVSNEGFSDIKIQYMGELWVLLEFVSEDYMKLFQDNVSIGSWFSQLKKASMEFNTEGRTAWVEIEGIPFKLWSDNTFKRIATKWGELLDIDDQDGMCFYSKRLCIYTKSEKNIFEEFKIIFRGKAFW